jgi:DNA-binding NtrC family response regulator
MAVGNSGLRGEVKKTRVLVVDDERAITDTLCAILSLAGYESTAAYNGLEGLQKFHEQSPALIISDVVMPQMNGIELAKNVHAADPDCAVLLFTGNATTHALLLDEPVDDCVMQVLAKPMRPQELLSTVASIFAERNASGLFDSAAAPTELPFHRVR